MSFTNQNAAAANAAGRARMLAIAGENKLAIEQLTAELVASLKRPATPGEVVEAELVATSVIKARRMRAAGRDDSRERELLANLGSVPAPPPVPPKIQILGPRSSGKQFFIAERGDVLATDEVEK